MNYVERKKRASLVAFVVMVLIALIPERSFLPKGVHFYDYHFMQGIAIIATAYCFIILIPTFHKAEFFDFFKVSWPLLIYVAVELGFLAYGYIFQDAPGLEKSFPRRFWVNYGATLLLMVCSFMLGYFNDWNTKQQGKFLAVVMGITALIVMGEYLTGSGIHNPIGDMVFQLNHQTDAIWKWKPEFETLRVTGLQRFPALLAFISVSVMAWALAAKENLVLRTLLFLVATVILFLTGARTEFIAALMLVFIAVLVKIQEHGFGGWLKKSLPILGVILIILGVVGVVYNHEHQTRFSAGIFTRVNVQSEQAEKQQQQGVSNLQKLDSITSGRATMWVEAIELIFKHPLGTGLPSGLFLKHSHAHDDFMSKYITEGPVGILGIIMMLAWMTNLSERDRTRSENIGLFFAVSIFVSCLTDGMFVQFPVLALPLFLMGLNTGPKKTNAVETF